MTVPFATIQVITSSINMPFTRTLVATSSEYGIFLLLRTICVTESLAKRLNVCRREGILRIAGCEIRALDSSTLIVDNRRDSRFIIDSQLVTNFVNRHQNLTLVSHDATGAHPAIMMSERELCSDSFIICIDVVDAMI